MADVKPAAKKPAPAPAKSPFSPSVSEIVVAVVLIVVMLPFLFQIDFSSGSSSPVAGAINSVVGFLKDVATVVTMIAVVIAVYSYIRLSELVAEEKKKLGLQLNWNTERKQKHVRWEKVEQYMTSLNSSDWKIAILEADNILDEIVERMGYHGATLGERMKNIEASDFPYLDEAWQVHKLRNAIAHKGTDYPLTRSEAEGAINMYHKVFKDLGYL